MTTTADTNNNNNDQSEVTVGLTDFVLEDISVNSTTQPQSNAATTNDTQKAAGDAGQWKHAIYNHLRQNLWLFPLLVSILLPLFSISSYIYAKHHMQITTALPFISDAIALAPQAGPASALFDIVNFFIIITCVVRYKQLKYYLVHKTTLSNSLDIEKNPPLNEDQLNALHQANFVSTISLYVGTFGLFIIANCRSTENQLCHIVGVTLFINGMCGYFLLMTYLTNRLNSVYGIESVPYTLATTSIVSAVTMFFVAVITPVSFFVAGPTNFINNKWRLNWTTEKPGVELHLITTVGEWIGIVLCGTVLHLCLFRRIKNFTEWHKVQF